MKRMTVSSKKMIALLLVATMLSPSLSTMASAAEANASETLTAQAGAVSINATNITLYGLNSTWEDYLTLPSDLSTSFQLEVSGASSVTYRVLEGDSVTVSQDGLLMPSYTTFYWNGGLGGSVPPTNGYDRVTVEGNYGVSTIEVTADGQKFEVTVDFEDYAQVYTDRVLDEFIAANVTDSMTDLEKLELATKYAADREYSTSFYTTMGMVISGGGDCLASSYTIRDLCKKMGVNVWIRSAAREYVGTTHWNVMAEIDGKYYVADAGYSEPAPRYYSIKERSSLFCYKTVSGGIELLQYDGLEWPSVMEILSEIDGKKVIGLGKDFVATGDMTEIILPDTLQYIKDSSFNSCDKLEKIHIPASVTEIGDFVFSNCYNLENFTCDADNPSYTIVDGVMYNKDMSILLYVPAVSELIVPETVKEIGYYACNSNDNLTRVVVPDSVETIAEGAFARCQNLKGVALPNTLSEISLGVFYQCYALTDICFSGSEEEWNAITVGEYNEPLLSAAIHCNTHAWNNGEVTTAPTHTAEGEMTYTCTACGETKTKMIANTPAHSYGEWASDGATTHTRTCECGATETVDHAWNDGEVTTAPTHTTEGEMTYTCTACGETKSEMIAKTTAHSFGEWASNGATIHTRTCECGATETADHAWNNGEVTTAPTHMREGAMTYTCTACGETKSEMIAKTPAHSFGEWASNGATIHTRTCECGATETADHAWDNGEVTTAPTHTAEGAMTYTCTACGEIKTESIAKTPAHSFGEWASNGATTHTRTCECGATETADHAWNDGEVTTAPTHTTEGEMTYTCTACGESKTQVLPALTEHDFESEWESDVDGHHGVCECGEKGIVSVHTYGEWNVTKESSETENGIKERSCTICEYKETVAIDLLPPTESPDKPVETPDEPQIPQTGDKMSVWIGLTALVSIAIIALIGDKKRAQHHK